MRTYAICRRCNQPKKESTNRVCGPCQMARIRERGLVSVCKKCGAAKNPTFGPLCSSCARQSRQDYKARNPDAYKRSTCSKCGGVKPFTTGTWCYPCEKAHRDQRIFSKCIKCGIGKKPTGCHYCYPCSKAMFDRRGRKYTTCQRCRSEKPSTCARTCSKCDAEARRSRIERGVQRKISRCRTCKGIKKPSFSSLCPTCYKAYVSTLRQRDPLFGIYDKCSVCGTPKRPDKSIYCRPCDRKKKQDLYRRMPYAVLECSRRRRHRQRAAAGSYTRAEWEAVVRKQRGRCADCGIKVKRLTVDHIVPISKGGTNYIINIRGLCQPCNSRKGASENGLRQESFFSRSVA